MKDRRKEERKSLMAYTQVFDLYGGFLLGYLSDLNLHGAMIIGERPQKENTEITLAIELPELQGISASRITLPARTAWCEQDLSPQFYNVGYEFKDVTPPQKKIIELIVQNYEFRRDTPSYPPRPAQRK